MAFENGILDLEGKILALHCSQSFLLANRGLPL
jgi:hypothetical protein